MKSSKPRIGRKIIPIDLDTQKAVEFRLSNGDFVKFSQITVLNKDIEGTTYIEETINGRLQENVTEESIADIISTIKYNQFYPAIGIRQQDKILILDGSRRRKAALAAGVDLNVLVTDTAIETSDAQVLAKQLQSAKEHNLREFGCSLLPYTTQMEQKDIAKKFNISESKVSRALVAAKVNIHLINVFPLIDELNYPDYQQLKKLEKYLSEQNTSIEDFIQSIFDQLNDLDAEQPKDLYKAEILSLLTQSINTKAPVKEKDVHVLKTFKDPNAFARMVSSDTKTNFEFNRLPKATIKKIKDSIAEILSE